MKKDGRPQSGRLGIQFRIIGLSMLFTLFTAAIILVTSAHSLSTRLRQDTLQSSEYAVQTAAESIRQDILEIDSLPNWCALNYSVRTAMLSDLPNTALVHTTYPLISNRYNSMRTALYIQRFLILTNSGRIIMFGTAASQSQSVTSDNAVLFPGMGEDAPSMQWDRLITDPLIQPGSTVTGIPLTRKISNSSGTACAGIYLSISPALITDVLKKFNLEDGSWLCWVMGDQLYRISGNSLVSLGSVDQLPQPETGTAATLDDGTLLYSVQSDAANYDLVVCPLDLHGLSLGVAIPEQLLTAPLHLLLSPVLTSLILVLIMGAGMAILLHRIVAVPISALQRQIDTVSQGDFSANPDIEWNHELGDVGRGINRLSQSVSDLMSKRLEDEKQRQDLEYRMLQNQISPHFIYNTLNSIKWMATIQHAPGVAEMVTALSRLLKSVSKGNQRLVPLQDEFSLLEDYFTIQRYRYGGTITLDLPSLEGEELSGYLIPRFTLQPLAENAIFHGIEPKGGVGRLSVVLERDPENGDLLIRLTDDGVGMTQERIHSIFSGSKDGDEESLRFRHVGVQNVHRLLQLSFGLEYGLHIQSEPGQGTTVTVRLPAPAQTP